MQALSNEQRLDLENQQLRSQLQQLLNPYHYDVPAEELSAQQQVQRDLLQVETIFARLTRRTEGKMVDPNFVLPAQPTAEGLARTARATSHKFSTWSQKIKEMKKAMPSLREEAAAIGRGHHQAACTDIKVRTLTGVRVQRRQARATLARELEVLQRRAVGLPAPSFAPPVPAPSFAPPVPAPSFAPRLVVSNQMPVPSVVQPMPDQMPVPSVVQPVDEVEEAAVGAIDAVHVDGEAEEVSEHDAAAEDAAAGDTEPADGVHYDVNDDNLFNSFL